MGIQVRCPLCGLTRPPQKFGQYDLAAKEVRSLGGDRGFEHVEIEMPSDLESDIELAIARLYHEYVDRDPFEVVRDIGEHVDEVVEAGTTDETGTKIESKTELKTEIESEIDQAIEHDLRIAEIDREVEDAIAGVIEDKIDRAVIESVVEDAIDGAIARRMGHSP